MMLDPYYLIRIRIQPFILLSDQDPTFPPIRIRTKESDTSTMNECKNLIFFLHFFTGSDPGLIVPLTRSRIQEQNMDPTESDLYLYKYLQLMDRNHALVSNEW